MKPFYKITFIACILQCLLCPKVHALVTTYDWTGATNGNWNDGRNWKVGGITQLQANYPGTSSSDIAQIGVSNTITITNQPTIPSAVSIATLIIGTKTSSVILTINAALTVSGDFTQKNDGSGNGVTTSITGTGTMYCLNFNLGDGTTPPTPIIGLANVTYKTILNFSLSGLTVGHNLVLTTTSTSALVNIFQSANVNNAIFNLNSGWVSVGNAIQTVDNNDVNLSGFTILIITYVPVSSSAQFLMNPTTGNSSIVYFNGSNPLNLDGNAGYVDFYGTAGGTSQVNYSADADQEVYTTSSAYSASRANANGLDRSPSVYQDLVFSGSLTKKADPGNLTIGHDFILSVASTPVADFATNSPAVTVGGAFTANVNTTLNLGGTGTMTVTGSSSNAGTLNQSSSGNFTFNSALSNLATGVISQSGTGAIVASCCFTNAGSYTQTSGSTGGMTITGNLNNSGTITQTAGNLSAGGNVVNSGTLTLGTADFTIGGNYNNTGTYSQSTGTTFFNGSFAETLQDASSNGTNFNNVSFSGSGVKTMSSGAFSVSSTGVLTMIGSNSSLASNGNLTLKSDTTGSATVAAVPKGATISGNVNVQRFMSGGSLSRRGYRLMSSPVNQGSNIYSINYLINSCYLTGTNGTAGGLDKTGNPTLYLFRENLAPQNTTFLNGSYRGINNILTSPLYGMDDTTYPTANIPVGNGYAFFFRGDRSAASPSSETTTTYVPVHATLTATGALNIDTITVRDWYTPTKWNLGYTVTAGNDNVRGLNLVGNPYASSINWDTFQTVSNTTGIYGSSVKNKIIVYDEITKTFGTYIAGSGGVGSQSFASNVIASGQGFFVLATCSCARLTFTESAKTDALPTGATLLMGTPPATVNNQYLRLQLTGIDPTASEQTLLRFKDNATMTYDDALDAYYKPGQGAVSLLTRSRDGARLCINTIPFPSNKSEDIKLNVNATTGGLYTLSLRDLVAVPKLYDIWLMDARAKDSLDMRQNKTYSFYIDKSDTTSFGNNRFTLVIRQNPAYAYHLLSFTAARLGNSSNVETHWTTANEANYTNFTVERSNDGGNTFTVVGGMWGTGAGDYGLMDKNAMTGTNLYRLKSEDINNTITYSNIATVVIADKPHDNADKLQVYPNPATSVINLDVQDKKENTSYNIIISNSTGLIIKQATSSQSNWQTDVSNLLPGTYLVRVTSNKTQDLVGESKFVKL